MPDISVSLDIEVVKIVCVLHLATVWTLQSLDYLSFHHPGNVSWQQRQQETLLMAAIQRQKKKAVQGWSQEKADYCNTYKVSYQKIHNFDSTMP